jgi:type I restriction enzyme S subunit
MSAIQQLITEHIDIWTAADIRKRSGRGRVSSNADSVYGVKKLRELILELAVMGKLVPQDANDEPAIELLEHIQAEKAKLVAEGKTKKEKPLPPINEDEKLFDLPRGWEWQRLPDTYYSISPKGRQLKGSEIKELGKYPVVDQGQSFISGYTDLTDLLIEIPHAIIVFGDHTTNIKLIDFNFVAGADGTKLLAPILIYPNFYYYYLQSYKLENRGYARHFKVLNNNLIAIPPIAEQQRIVAKVDELMALCDQLEAQHNIAAEAHENLVNHLLGTLTESESADDFSANWQCIAAHFDTIFTTEASIDALKQTLLQLAVMGKLVPQDANDEPAIELLEHIQAETIKPHTDWVDFSGLEELKKDIPSKWTWIRLGEIADIVRGGSPRPAGDLKFYEGNIPFLKVGDITRSKGKMVDGYTSTIKPAGLTKTRFIDTRTVLLTNSGATLGVPAICDFETTFNDGVAAFINLSSKIFDEYLYLYLKSISAWFLEVAAQGQGQPNLNTDIIRSTWIPITSVSEQHRIVTKVDELMALCDQLKTRIQQANQQQQTIANVLVAQVLN